MAYSKKVIDKFENTLTIAVWDVAPSAFWFPGTCKHVTPPHEHFSATVTSEQKQCLQKQKIQI